MINVVKKTVLIGIAVALLAQTVLLMLNRPVEALSGSQFKAGHIIDNHLFFDGNTMTPSEIQAFLNAKVPDCDENGDIMYNATQTRKQYAASQGVSTPFECLKNYKQNTPARPGESGLCSALSAKSNRNAAYIINDVAGACGINEKVLLVLLQKEQSLVTDDWPWPIQYRSATGYGCPDGAPCDSEYYGFFNQVYMAARQFKRYAADPTHYNHRAKASNSVRYHPNISCGSSTVYIENQATAGLYNYTPYRPNSAALNNLYGTGNSCSSYGNRNFWRMYNDWFGPTLINPKLRVTTSLKSTPSSTTMGNDVTTSFVIKNYEDVPIELGGLKAAVRAPDGSRVDYPQDSNIVIPAKSTYTYSKTQPFHQKGKYEIWVASYQKGYGWSFAYPAGTNSSIDKDDTVSIRGASIRVTTSIKSIPNPLTAGSNATISFVIKNYETFPVRLDALKAAARDPNGVRADLPQDSNITIPAKSTYTYTKTQALSTVGTYNFWVYSYRQGYGWSSAYPKKTNSSIIKSINVQVTP